MTRVMVIALQEATRDLIDPWARQGLLPNIAALMDSGSCGHVVAQAPLITPHSWANVLTGVNAGRHGVYDYWQRDDTGHFVETTSASLQAEPMWSLLRGTGIHSTIVNLPLTWPPPKLDGLVVAGQHGAVSPRDLFAAPEIYDGLRRALGEYTPNATAPGGRSKRDYIDLFDTHTPRTAASFEYCLTARDWDFAMVYFIDVAMAQHYFWADMDCGDDNPHRDVILSAYRNIDAAIGQLVRAAGRDTAVFLMSECGAGRMRSGIDLNFWLEQNGWYFPRHSMAARPIEFLENHALPIGKRLMPYKLKSAFKACSPALNNWASSSGTRLNADWSRTQIFMRGKEGNLFVNLAGRDPHGIVQPGAEYDELLVSVTDALTELEDPQTGEPAVANVWRPSELYSGPSVGRAPDLIVDWAEAAYMMTETRRGDAGVFVERWRKGMSWPTTGSHRYDGVLIAAGAGIAAGKRIGKVSQFDLLPTWLSLLGQPVPEHLEGRALTEMIEV